MEDGKAVLRANWTAPADAFVLHGPGELSSYNDSAREYVRVRARIYDCIPCVSCAATALVPVRINPRMNREDGPRYFGSVV